MGDDHMIERLLEENRKLGEANTGLGTALSDEEAEHQDDPGHLWHIKYPVKGRKGHVEIATTRPETMLGDTAVAVNPKDERYKKIVGKKLSQSSQRYGRFGTCNYTGWTQRCWKK